jgi:hypothetical protein
MQGVRKSAVPCVSPFPCFVLPSAFRNVYGAWRISRTLEQPASYPLPWACSLRPNKCVMMAFIHRALAVTVFVSSIRSWNLPARTTIRLKVGNAVRSDFTVRAYWILLSPLNELRGKDISKSGKEFESKMPDKTFKRNEFHLKRDFFLVNYFSLHGVVYFSVMRFASYVQIFSSWSKIDILIKV